MANPKKRKTKSSVGTNRAHQALKKVITSKCQKCGKPIMSHCACTFCGNYKGKQVLKIKTKTAKTKK